MNESTQANRSRKPAPAAKPFATREPSPAESDISQAADYNGWASRLKVDYAIAADSDSCDTWAGF
ncbi:MAG TPA: hypothetical protein VHE55_13220 [Fimbriimonadaceae bacterium]|nr:hypothetical protein [Fimbriimonadaceae bacterium]